MPYPIKDGEVIAITNLAKALHSLGHELTLLCINTPKHFFDPQQLPGDFNFYKTIETVEVDTDVKPLGAFLNLFSTKSYHIARFDSNDFKVAMIHLLQSHHFDVVQMETLFLAPYLEVIRKYSTAKIVMRAHNLESEIWERIVTNTPSIPKRYYLKYLTKKLRNFEQEKLNQYDLLVPITNRDLANFEKMGFVGDSQVIPIGIDEAEYKPNWNSFQEEISVSFIGSLDWMPNQEGLYWFLKACWPLIQQKNRKISLHIAGRNTPPEMYQRTKENIQVAGEVESAKDFINAHSLMIVPLLSGSGMRVKILEGMALGRMVITTTIGLEGIEANHQKEVLIADTVEQFVEAFQFCFDHPDQLMRIGKAAQKLIAQKYDNLEIGKTLESALLPLIQPDDKP